MGRGQTFTSDGGGGAEHCRVIQNSENLNREEAMANLSETNKNIKTKTVTNAIEGKCTMRRSADIR